MSTVPEEVLLARIRRETEARTADVAALRGLIGETAEEAESRLTSEVAKLRTTAAPAVAAASAPTSSVSATVAVGTVTTTAPGSLATVVNGGTPAAVVLNFGIPAGEPGIQGPRGLQGPPGPGSGDVAGPASAVSGNIATFSGTTGKTIQDGGKALPAGDIVGTTSPGVATLPALSGENLTALNASNITAGTLPDGRFPATLPAVSGANLTNLPAGNLTGTVPAARMPAFSGDATSSAGATALTLAASGVTAGSYTRSNITVDAKGRVTAAANGSTAADLPTGGAAHSRLRKNSTTNYDASWAPSSVFDVTDYGVVYGNPAVAAANSAAIAVALGALNTAGGGVLYFPPLGTCYISTVISLASAVSWEVRGGGWASTAINQTTTNTGVFSVTQYDRLAKFAISDLWLTYSGTEESNTASAIICQNHMAGANDGIPNFKADRILIDAITKTRQAAFARGFDLRNQKIVSLTECTFTGRPANGHGIGLYLDRVPLGSNLGPRAGNDVPDTAPSLGDYYTITSSGTSQGVDWVLAENDYAFYGGASGVWSKYDSHSSTKCIAVTISQCGFNSCSAGVYIAYDMEGFVMSNSATVGCEYGIRFAMAEEDAPASAGNQATMVHMAVVNCHMNTSKACIATEKRVGGVTDGSVWQAQITNNLFYVSQLGPNAYGVKGRFRHSTIHGNTFGRNPVNAAVAGVYIYGTPGLEAFGNCVSGNVFAAFAEKCVWFGSRCTYSRSSGNTTHGDGATNRLGAWDSGTTYAVSAEVTRLGSSYLSKVGDNTNNPPESSPTQWLPLAAIFVNDGGTTNWMDPEHVAGTGFVVSPASAVTDGHIAVFDGTTGKVIKTGSKALPAGAIVGTSDAQTLTNKTLTSSTITSPLGIVKGDVGLGNVANVDTTDAGNISSGTLPDGRFPATLPAASGANLTALNASNLTSGNLHKDRVPSTLAAISDGTEFSVTWNPGTVSAGSSTWADLAVTGAAFGQHWVALPPYSTDVCTLSAAVISSGNVRILLSNATGFSPSFASGSWKVRRVF